MAEQLGPLDICCDAPPYGIVRGCRLAGIHNPEDVAWHRLGRYLRDATDPQGMDAIPTWKAVLGLGGPAAMECVCGQRLPRLDTYVFTLGSGAEVSYVLGQCDRCRTVYWEEAPGPRGIAGT